jgi:hypothetical protein
MPKKRFSITGKESEYFNDEMNYIELENCPRGGGNCENHRAGINQSMVNARQFRMQKDYKRSIQEYKSAFSLTHELENQTCKPCAELFQSVILKALEQTQDELKSLTTGLFAKKNLRTSYQLAQSVLTDLKKHNGHGSL